MIQEEQLKRVPEPITLIRSFLNTHYGHDRHEHSELANPEQLRTWLVAHNLLASEAQISEGDFRRVLQLREAIRNMLRESNEEEASASHIANIEVLNQLACNAPLTVHFRHAEGATLVPDIAGVDGAIARLVASIYTSMTNGSWERLKVCRNERCQKAFYDTSKNHSGVWCSMAICGSRLKAHAYRQRRATQTEI